MWVAVLIVATVGLCGTLGHPTSEGTPGNIIDTPNLKQPTEEKPGAAVVCNSNCEKENEISNETIIGDNNNIDNTTVTGCTCVTHTLCADETSGRESLGPDTNPIECPHSFERCCFNFTGVEEPTTTTTVTLQNSSPPSFSTVASEGKCGRHIGLTIDPHYEDPDSDTFYEAKYGEFPWMVWIGNPSLTTRCGGSLIHPKVVLTGAHCVNGKEDVVVRVGDWSIQTEGQLESYPHQEVKVKEFVIHESFNKGSLAHDLALLILDTPVNLTGSVGIVCLSETLEEFDDHQCFMSGWGDLLNSTEQLVMKRVGPLPIVPRDECQEALRKTKLKEHFRLHDSFICAAGGTSAKSYTCKGDGGGPLVCPSRTDPNVYIQAGILAWGISCGPATPAVYVNVPHFIPWIHDQLRDRGILPLPNLDSEENAHLLIDIRI